MSRKKVAKELQKQQRSVSLSPQLIALIDHSAKVSRCSFSEMLERYAFDGIYAIVEQKETA